jgi:hypothetical protein
VTWQERLLTIFVFAAFLAAIVVPIYLFLFGGHRRFLLGPLNRCFRGIQLHESPDPGDVSFVYHTYRGLLIWFTQTEHRVIAPREDAERLLKRLLRFNLTWGMLSYGLVFIPLVAYGNYVSQRRSIAEQVAAQTSR